MRKPEHISIEEYDYPLTNERIAKYPLEKRSDSKLLFYQSGRMEEWKFANATNLLNTSDQLYFNKTRVVQARLQFKKVTGAAIEIFILDPVSPDDYQIAFSSKNPVEFICLVGNAKKWKEGLVVLEYGDLILHAEKIRREEEKFVIRFSWNKSDTSFAEILEEVGSTPIPPYLKRKAEKTDSKTYQTVYAEQDGSVAAPTAGLHFTDEILDQLKQKGVQSNQLVLHVGAGTFIPVKHENAVDHSMHAEFVTVEKEMLESLLNKKRVIAVGTTSTRSLESLYWIGLRAHRDPGFSFENIFLDQWDAYDLSDDLSLQESIQSLLDHLDNQNRTSFSFYTRIMITPGYEFKVIDGLFTNFHQPKSTLLLLIAALVGDDWKRIYDFALENDFRFLSYGDSSLLLRVP
jgi:S-adenosylmethionine:tRNA ribosyltransferase-isomerase